MGDYRRPRLNMGDQKSPKIPLDLTAACTCNCHIKYDVHVHVHVHPPLPALMMAATQSRTKVGRNP